MKWSNVGLIFFRELRDQLRDRRTLFTIAVLPLLLYPLLGMSIFQVTQFMREHPTKIWIISNGPLPDEPPLLEGRQFASGLCPPEETELMIITRQERLREPSAASDIHQLARQAIEEGRYDAVVYFPGTFVESLRQLRERMLDGVRGERDMPGGAAAAEIITNEANDKSKIAGRRVEGVLARWRKSVVDQNLIAHAIPTAATQPFEVIATDVAPAESRRAAVWSKILPLVLLVWALTGAFYPAIDLCAGEKERGTLETLLSSPAQRGEIVWGKLLTVMVFSMATSLLNLVSMGLTGTFIIAQMERLGATTLGNIGPPPIGAVGWLLLALVPISALFSALSLAIATFARSSREGQYYLMPLLMISLPLMLLAMVPAAELDWGTSLIPLTGVMLLLQAFVEGRLGEALQFAAPVVGVTGICCLLAIRWASAQFNNESVLFRENERWELGVWLRHLVRDRGLTPTFGEAIMCGVILLVIRFFANFLAPASIHWTSFATTTVVMQLAFIATPVLLMAIILTRSPRQTLLLTPTRPLALLAALLLAVTLNPLVQLLGEFVQWLYPMSPNTVAAMEPLLAALQQAPLWQALLVIALMPALCEELAFRGFILSGLRHTGRKWTAIVLSSVFFGIAHGIPQQSLTTCIVGLVIGYLAVHSGSLLPCMVFHFTNNALGLLLHRLTPQMIAQQPLLRLVFHETAEGNFSYAPAATILALAASGLLLVWFGRLRYQRYPEEELQRSLQHQH